MEVFPLKKKLLIVRRIHGIIRSLSVLKRLLGTLGPRLFGFFQLLIIFDIRMTLTLISVLLKFNKQPFPNHDLGKSNLTVPYVFY